jgi:hypothetical protein
MKSTRAAIPFLTIGVALIAIGISGNRTFMYAGLPFLVLGFVLLMRSRR